MALTITITLEKEEAINIVQSVPPKQRSAFIEEAIIMRQRIADTIQLTEANALGQITDQFQGLQTRLENMFREVGKSARLGQLGQQEILRDLNIVFNPVDRFEDVSGQSQMGDIQGILGDGTRVMIEVKKYSSAVPKTEVFKFWRDMAVNNCRYGVFVSLDSEIAGMAAEHFSVQKQDQRCAIFVVNTAFDHTGHRLAIQYLKRLIELDRLSTAAISRVELNARLNEVAARLKGVRDYANSLAKVSQVIDSTRETVQQNLANAYAEVQVIKTRIDDMLDLADAAMRALSGQATPTDPVKEAWSEILDLFEDHPQYASLQTVRADLSGRALVPEPVAGEEGKYRLVCQGREVACLLIDAKRVSLLTLFEPPQELPKWKAPGKRSPAGWTRVLTSPRDTQESMGAIAEFLAGCASSPDGEQGDETEECV